MTSKKLITAISMICLMSVLLVVGVWAVTDVDFIVVGSIKYIAPSVLTFSYDDTTMTASVIKCNTSVTSVEIPSSILHNGNTYIVTSIYDATSSSDGAFYNCISLTNITIPDSVTSIGDYAFNYCKGLTSITIPNSVTSIGDYAFSDCAGLTTATIGTGVISIGESAFCRCSGLTGTLTIPDSVTSIGKNAFFYCTGLTTATIGTGVISIEYGAFWNCTGLTSISIPNSVTSMGDYAFSGCTKLTYNTSNNAKYLGNSTNKYVVLVAATSTSITSCTINSGCKIIYGRAFSDCTKLTSIKIPDSVTCIVLMAFNRCTGLTTATIGTGVISIGNSAFLSCTKLTSITIPNSVTSIEDNAFSDCSGLTSINVDSENSVYDSRNNCNAIIETSTDTLILGCKNTTILNTVKAIGYRAFTNCTGLTGTLTIPDSVTSIGNYAFSNSGLTSITIPDSVTSIGNFAFFNSIGFTTATIGTGVTSIGEGAFFYCSKLATVNVKATSVPTGGSSMFDGCSTSLEIYVPSASLSAYQSATNWSSYSSKMVGTTF